MAHKQQIRFCKSVRRKYPAMFRSCNVIDVGSLDINGNNRRYFYRPNVYVGIDVYPGDNVDIVGPAHLELLKVQDYIKRNSPYRRMCDYEIPDYPIDVVISTEMLEHDQYWDWSLRAMYDVLKPGGLLLITAAGPGRPEHGTSASDAWCSPGTVDYYRNISNLMFQEVLVPSMFKEYYLNEHPSNCDLQFYGIKRA